MSLGAHAKSIKPQRSRDHLNVVARSNDIRALQEPFLILCCNQKFPSHIFLAGQREWENFVMRAEQDEKSIIVNGFAERSGKP